MDSEIRRCAGVKLWSTAFNEHVQLPDGGQSSMHSGRTMSAKTITWRVITMLTPGVHFVPISLTHSDDQYRVIRKTFPLYLSVFCVNEKI